jgi:hypothetical protein
MTTQTSGQISIFDLKTEFSGPAIFDYYVGSGHVIGSIVRIPPSGTIKGII